MSRVARLSAERSSRSRRMVPGDGEGCLEVGGVIPKFPPKIGPPCVGTNCAGAVAPLPYGWTACLWAPGEPAPSDLSGGIPKGLRGPASMSANDKRSNEPNHNKSNIANEI